MIIIDKKPLNLVGTIVARDEEDIIGPMIEHHVEQGIKDILFTDNSSKDRTRKIAEKYPEVREIVVSEDMTHNQESHTTRMARTACKFEPDWIIHMDADELWGGFHELEDNIKETAVWTTKAHVHPPVQGEEFNFRRQRHYIDFKGFAREYKVMHRPNPNIVVCHGNHHVQGVACGYTKAVLRHHYPIRSYKQFERKVVQGATALKARGFVCERWYKWKEMQDAGELKTHYDMLVRSWGEMLSTQVIDVSSLGELLIRCYGVQPDTAEQTFTEMKEAGIYPSIRSWLPFEKDRSPFSGYLM